MLKKTNFVLLFIFATICLFAQNVDKPIIVVTPIDLYDVEQKAGDLLTRKIQSEFSQTAKFTVVDRNSFDKIFAQQKFQNSEWSNLDKIAEMKKAFNAQYIVTSSVENYNSSLYVVINIIDVNSTVIIASENSKSESVGELMSSGVKNMVTKIVTQGSMTDMSADISEKPVVVLTECDLFDVEKKDGDMLFRKIQSELSKTKQFVVVDRGSFKKILAELKFQDTEWSNPDKIAALKKAFNARYIVNTSIDNYDGTLYVTSNIIDVNSTVIVASGDTKSDNVDGLMNSCVKDMVTNIANQVRATDMSDEIEKKIVIVLTEFDLFDIEKKSGDVLFRKLQSEFSKMKQFVVVDRGSFKKILAELKFQDTEWSNPDKIAALKKAFNARYIVNTSIDNYDGTLYVTSNIIDVNSTAVLASVNVEAKSVNELINSNIENTVGKILYQIGPKIGDIGPGGGTVFYFSEEGFRVYESDGVFQTYYYMECSDVLSDSITWCCSDGYCCAPETKTSLGYGKMNTSNIISYNHRDGQISESNCAAVLCSKYATSTTKSGEWWLPSKDELNLIYTNLKSKGYISDSSSFWSSSSYNR